jgi:uncharacterized protein YjbI with pentapeptide repeats
MNQNYIENETFKGVNFVKNSLLKGEYEYCTFNNCAFSNVNISGFNL